MKEFKDNEELIEYLKSKKLTIINKEQTLRLLERYSYYSIINGYKNVFKDKQGNYKANSTFDEIFALYEFDKNIKSLLLKYILEIEVVIKSLMANTIAKEYGIQDYLQMKNFDSNSDANLVDTLIFSINKEINDNYNKHSAIKHYKDNYGFVPPFVLTKILTFGFISRYYGLLKQEDRQKISKYFKISDKLLKQILINLTVVRNIAAHSDRLFCYRSKFYIRFKSIEKDYKITGNFTNLYMIIKCIKLLLDNKQYNEFENLFNNELDNLKDKLVSISIDDILRIMGYTFDV